MKLSKPLVLVSLFIIHNSAKAQIPDLSNVPGIVVTHVAQSSGQYIGSPSITILPNGDYVASHDLFGPSSSEHTQAVSRVFKSSNRGKTWRKIAEIQGQFWSKLFVHQNTLFLFGTDKHNGNIVIRKSVDQGVSWTEPVDERNGLLKVGEYHCAPMAFIVHNGRLWRAMESVSGSLGEWDKRHTPFVMSIPLDADPMVADNWLYSDFVLPDMTLLEGKFTSWVEGNVIADPEGQLWDILRVNHRSDSDEKAAFVRISEDGKVATFDPATGFLPFPGGSKKFTIRYDPKSKKYWTLTNYIPDQVKAAHQGTNPSGIRNTQALFSSDDLKKWEFRKTLLYHEDVINHGFQYVDWLFEGKDIVFLSRTAYEDGIGGARNNHDANLLTFHRIKNFRKVK